MAKWTLQIYENLCKNTWKLQRIFFYSLILFLLVYMLPLLFCCSVFFLFRLQQFLHYRLHRIHQFIFESSAMKLDLNTLLCMQMLLATDSSFPPVYFSTFSRCWSVHLSDIYGKARDKRLSFCEFASQSQWLLVSLAACFCVCFIPCARLHLCMYVSMCVCVYVQKCLYALFNVCELNIPAYWNK